MRSQTRSACSTVWWLTVYVGLAPFVSIGALMLLARSLGAVDDGWGWIFGTGYLAALHIGAQAFAAHFEKR